LTLLALHDVGFAFPTGGAVVRNVDLALRRGEILCLVGRSGCGKTTLLKLAAGLLEPTSGRIEREGHTPAGPDVGFVFQAPTLLEWRRVIDNVLLPVSLHRPPSADDVATAEGLLRQVGLGEHLQRYPRQLSGGQQSRVALVRGLLLQPALLLLDEPFAALDAITREELQHDLLRMCRARGTTVLFVTHDIGEAVYLADRIGVMEGGCVVQQIQVKLPRPRTTDHRYSGSFAECAAQVRAAMHIEDVAA
jgi:NitT/TauT family transport system ATP-binding protein